MNLLGKIKPRIEDIAWSLSSMRRYGGHGIQYSVAQHSVIVSQRVPRKLALRGLLHDAHEAYVTDLPKHVKAVLEHLAPGKWEEFEHGIAKQVRTYFGVPGEDHPVIKDVDSDVAHNEIGSLFSEKAKAAWVLIGVDPRYAFKVVPLSTQQAYELFINRYYELGQGVT